MASAPPPDPGAPADSVQLAQVRVPLQQAGIAFETTDEAGRTPIVVLPRRDLRIRVDILGLAGALVLAALLGLVFEWSIALVVLAVIGAVVLAALACLSAFFVRVPEGTSALLVQGGRHMGVLGPGTHVVMPWIIVSHVVTRRQIPFDLPTLDAPTRDNVGARVDGLLTFIIADPARFVYAVAAPDFDLVLQAACRDGLRSLLRQLTWSSVLDIGAEHTEVLRAQIEAYVAPYGVNIGHLNITQASPQAEFLRSEEARQLATVQRAEATEQHALAELRLLDQQQLEKMRVSAELDRQEFRLSHLEELLKRYPHAADWQWQGDRLEVARALAANHRSILHLGRAAEIMTTMWPDPVAEPKVEAPHANGPAGDSLETP